MLSFIVAATIIGSGFFITNVVKAEGSIDENMTIEVSPSKDSLIELAPTKNFVLTVDANDYDGELYELEVDHNMAGNPETTPEFSVYADSEDPYNGDGEEEQKAIFDTLGVDVTYSGNEINGTWTIDFGKTITNRFIENDGIEFYLRVKDDSGERFSGPFNGPIPDNTFAYTVARVDENMTIEVSPSKDSLIELAPTKNFVLTVDANDYDGELYELEVDHNMAGNPETTPEFSVYADSEDPYNGDGEEEQKAIFDTLGVDVTYSGNEINGTWTIDFGKTITNRFIENDGIEFYLRVKDDSGERFSGPFNGPIPDNTFAYTITRDTTAPTSGQLTMSTTLQDITINTPTDGVYAVETPLSFNGVDVFQALSIAVTDENLDTENVPVSINGTENGQMTHTEGVWNYTNQNGAPEFTEGPQTITATFKDTAGNETPLSLTFTTDITAPTSGELIMSTTLQDITINTPTDGVYAVETPLSFNGVDVFQALSIAVTDENLDTENVPVSINGTENGQMTHTEGVWNYTNQNGAPEFTEGPQTITATFKDTAGNETPLSLTFTTDITAPVIELAGSSQINLFVGTPYTDEGAIALDNIDGTIASTSIKVTGSVDTSKAGVYTLAYNVRDSAGNSAIEVTRTVNVNIIPVITPVSNSSGGGGGYIAPNCTSVTYGEWDNPVNGFEYRDVLTQTPNNCSLSTSQQSAKSRIYVAEIDIPVETPPEVTTPVVTSTKQVLGEKIYADGTLIRYIGESKIYVFVNGEKQLIRTLAELQKYAGQEILNVSKADSQTEVLGEKIYADGTLIRYIGESKIYVIVNGEKQPIKNLGELKKYAGQEILNVYKDGSQMQVLGEKIYADGSLLRGTDKKIYVLSNGKLQHINNLIELRKYAGKKINNVTDDVINSLK